ncbi:sensor histidine kinase [Paenibacillus hunanensis]|uniref:histidine kinase n=1 Tax=Paenibacillus hunanensis TaxID=539262 RepID=A0ABU1J013_9BACL|nr:HAMP domain-containing sensor histidine kinase [Paenibacillus hunanensis]MDR6244847.1 signal transduction histidine kinase [Paenibacillus hunanensis]GGJ04611.1 two-component sensor histidine kinase [Paenibacillus hunanensis]
MGIKIHKRKTTLRRELFKYLVALGLSFVLVIGLYLALTTFAISAGWVFPANYNEQLIKQGEPIIREAPVVHEDMLPLGSKYVVLDKQSHAVLYGNMDDAEVKLASQLVNGRSPAYYGQTVYTLIERPNDYCVLQSDLRPQFSSPYLRSHLPNYEWTGNVLLGLSIVIISFLVTTIFARRFQNSLKTLTRITRHIQNQNLDFAEKKSGIKEFDDVAQALTEMKDALQQSLETQWKMEQTKQEQIAALAHDIKIPVTIIRGNAELLSLSEQNHEQDMYTRYILNASDKIDQHVRMLIMMSRTGSSLTLHKENVAIQEWLKELLSDTRAYAGCKHIAIEQQGQCTDMVVPLDKQLFHRALMNIIANALDHTPEGASMHIDVHCDRHGLTLVITDSGPGFTPEALEKATELFYRGDKGRNADGHYGMGLTFADYVIKLHHGSLQLQNDLKGGGGQVTIRVPVATEEAQSTSNMANGNV